MHCHFYLSPTCADLFLCIWLQEAERAAAEQVELRRQVAAARALADSWEAQAQEALAQIERLKDMLAESAAWSADETPTLDADAAAAGSGAPTDGATGAEAASAAAAGDASAAPEANGTGAVVSLSSEATAAGSNDASSAMPATGVSAAGNAVATASGSATVQRLQTQLLQSQARAAELDLQVRALTIELLKSRHVSTEVCAAYIPALQEIESRLARLHALGSGATGQAAPVAPELAQMMSPVALVAPAAEPAATNGNSTVAPVVPREGTQQ